MAAGTIAFACLLFIVIPLPTPIEQNI